MKESYTGLGHEAYPFVVLVPGCCTIAGAISLFDISILPLSDIYCIIFAL
jgi:hypothetical protein